MRPPPDAVPREEERGPALSRGDTLLGGGGESVANPCPGRRSGGNSNSLFRRTPGCFVSQAGDHRAADSQIVQITGGQRIQFANGLAIDCVASAIFLIALNRSRQTSAQAGCGRCVLCLGEYGHCFIPCIFFGLAPGPDGPALRWIKDGANAANAQWMVS